MRKVKVTIRKPKFLLESSYYDHINNEIVILDTKARASALYHEYRHHVQFQYLSKWCRNYILNLNLFDNILVTILVLLFIFDFSEACKNFAIILILVYTPRFLLELDANIFALMRVMRKKRPLIANFSFTAISMSSYVFNLYIFPLFIFFLADLNISIWQKLFHYLSN